MTAPTRNDVRDQHVTEYSRPARRLSTETKSSFKTTEMIFYVLAVAGVLLASYLVKTTAGHHDYFRADKAWFYIVLLTIGYLGSRGLAKAGSRDHYDADDHS
jgi:hypothetical protein